ncbi:hypothetical protein [Microbacterium rhizophilus]|uniref:hypothetical protein n=1 Tax=Microbacterium rhizophilus TaxID=3138934 RepID=UPI0031E5A659
MTEPSPEAIARVREQYGTPVQAAKRPASGQIAALWWIAAAAWVLGLVLLVAIGPLALMLLGIGSVAPVGAIVLAGVRELLPPRA